MSKGKLIDKWIYEHQGISSGEESAPDGGDLSLNESRQKEIVQPIKVNVNLYLVKKYKDSTRPPLETKEVAFTIECNNPKFSVHGSDIEAMRKEMWSHLDKFYEVKWTTYYEVKIGSAVLGTGISFERTVVYKGVAYDGSLLLKRRAGGRDWGDYIISEWPGEYRDYRGQVVACIEATQENEDALDEFAARINLLKDSLSKLLKPDVIMKTLQSLSANTILPALSKSGENK